MDDHGKYKMFRNFMANELGITRGDIRQWTEAAVTAEVQRQLGQMNLDGKASSILKDGVRGLIRGPSYRDSMSEEMRKIVRAAIGEELAGKIKVTLAE